MASADRRTTPPKIRYPTSDGRPMAETDDHRDLMAEQIETLKMYKAGDPRFYVSGNLLVFYEPGNRWRHVAPDVFVVRGVPKHNRDNYLIWEEGKGPESIIELTSRSTKKEDLEDKFRLYRDVLKVSEYFLFDPHNEYLDPPLQGYRLRNGKFVRIRAVNGRLPSKVLGLHLEQSGSKLRLYDPKTRRYVPTPQEVIEHANTARRQAEAARRQAELARRQAEAARQEAEANNEKLRRELETLRRRLNGKS
jgi:Uma2 family endonuclease